MNQGKLEVVKQEMARVNIDILGISELKCQDLREASEAGHLSHDQGKGQPREQARGCPRQRSGGCS